jgi:hypothetical protein
MMYAWLFLHTLLWASPKQKITLQDGSVILGELKGFDGQSYTFATDTLGEIKLPVEKVRSLSTYSNQEENEKTVNIQSPIESTSSNSTHTYNDYNYDASFSPQEPKEARSPNSPRQPKEPLVPSTADVPYYPPNYQQKSSPTENDANTSLIYGINNSTNRQSISDMQSMMMADNQMMGLIIEMNNDPDMSKILNNPQIMLYMSTGNMEELQKNSELQRLMSKPEMQQLMQMMQQ